MAEPTPLKHGPSSSLSHDALEFLDNV